MKRTIICAAVAALTLVACEKQNVEHHDQVPETVTLKVNVPVTATKVAGTASETAESAVGSYQIFVFSRPSGNLESYLETSSSTGELICTTGEKDIVVVANAPDLSDVNNIKKLREETSELSDNSIGALVMEGSEIKSITSDSSVSIYLKRNVAKVRLKKVETAFALDAYKTASIEIKAVYLIRVAAEKLYLSDTGTPGQWLSEQTYESDSVCDAFLYDSVTGVSLADKATYSSPHYFYCYPNPFSKDSSPEKATRLVVEASLNGATCFYPVTLPAVKKNHVYDVALKITRPGVANPSDDTTQYASDFTIEVQGWDETISVSETI